MLISSPQRQTLFGLSLLLMTASCAGAAAAGDVADVADVGLRGAFSFDLALGALSGEAREHVFNPDGSDLSRLDWQYDNNVALSGQLHYQFWDWLGAGVRGRIALTGESQMDDYDWGIVGCPGGFCHSLHDKTDLLSSTSIDLFVDSSLYDIGVGMLGLTAGYKADNSSWDAYGGIANYAFLDHSLGISYQQSWSTPYIGITLEGEADRFSWAGRLIGSAWVEGSDEDTHHLRDLLFEETFSGSSMYGGNVALGYAVTDNTRLKFSYDYQEWLTATGSTTITDKLTGAKVYIPGDAGGASNAAQTLSVGFGMKF